LADVCVVLRGIGGHRAAAVVVLLFWPDEFAVAGSAQSVGLD
tara:strand:+ start:99519 stop:99644 length:126 start_codon:yes stop_codon:yes gene_type:complete